MSSILENLPADVARELAMKRHLSTKQAAEFFGFSESHFRFLVRTGKLPAPVRLSAKKLGWPIGTLIAFRDAKAAEAQAA